ncbi:MAG: hypothetical protein K6T16_01210 [Candidatus Pacearchaeota archaeon]|nr:hypothetical protein [Candidatus Pacearchaeota archaeon]
MFGKIFKKKRVENEAVLDLGKLKEIEDRERRLKEATTGGQTNAADVGFLGTLASAASTSSTEPVIAVSGQDSERMDKLSRRINHVVDRLELIERKIERIERRIDLKY